MSGKTRMAATCVCRVYPDAPSPLPRSGGALRSLADELDLSQTIVWLDDLERYLNGADAIDAGLLERVTSSGAAIVATMRRAELAALRPFNDDRPPGWDVVRQFHEVALSRLLSTEELEAVRESVSDDRVVKDIERFGLAEYLGAGPEAIGIFDDGETTNPVGHALVRAAIDWRRAGLVRPIPITSLFAAAPATSMTEQMSESGPPLWNRVSRGQVAGSNETVSLLLLHDGEDGQGSCRVAEAFDYLIDVFDERGIPVPTAMWRIVAESAAAGESTDVARRLSFVGRTRTLAVVAGWLSGPPSDDRLLVVVGGPGTGKSALLAHLVSLADPKVKAILSTRQRTAGQLSSNSIGAYVRVGQFATVDRLRDAIDADLRARQAVQSSPFKAFHPVTQDSLNPPMTALPSVLVSGEARTILLDGLDESRDWKGLLELVNAVSTYDRVPHRVLATTRRTS